MEYPGIRSATVKEISSLYPQIPVEAITEAINQELFFINSNGDIYLDNSTTWFQICYQLELEKIALKKRKE